MLDSWLAPLARPDQHGDRIDSHTLRSQHRVRPSSIVQDQHVPVRELHRQRTPRLHSREIVAIEEVPPGRALKEVV